MQPLCLYPPSNHSPRCRCIHISRHCPKPTSTSIRNGRPGWIRCWHGRRGAHRITGVRGQPVSCKPHHREPPACVIFLPLSRTTGSRCAAAQFCGAGRAYAGRSGGGWGGAGRNALGQGHGGQTRLPDALPRRRTTGPGAVSVLACRRDSLRAPGMGGGKSGAYGANVSRVGRRWSHIRCRCL